MLNSWNGATGKRRSRQIRLVSVLSSEMPFASTREPVYGICSISNRAGTCASRASPQSLGDVEANIRFFVLESEKVAPSSAWIKQFGVHPFRCGANRVNGLDVVKVGKSIRWHALRLRESIYP